jgi:hypothetical protein
MDKQMAKIVTTLTKARNLIIKKGWCQGAFYNGKGYCAYGAISAVASSGKDYFVTEERKRGAAKTLASCITTRKSSDYRGNIYHYNDAPARKKSQVVALFDRAIKKATK